MVRRKNTLPKGSFLHRRSCIHTDFSHIAHKRRNVRFKGLRWVHTPPQPLNAHTAAHRANGAGKRGAALRGTFESTTICAKRFQIRDEKNRGSRITAAKLRLPAKGGLTQFGGAAGPQARAAPLLYLASHRWVPRFFRSQQQDAEKHICCFTRWSAPCVLPLAAVPLLCPQHPSAADKIPRWKTGSAGSCRADFRFACARPA